MVSAMCGAFAYLFGNELKKALNPATAPFAVSGIGAAVAMYFLEKLAKKYPKLGEYNLGIAMIVGMICAVVNAFPPIVIEAFTYVSPAIFGAIFSLYASKKIKYGAFALVVVGIMLLVIKVLPTYVMIPVAVFSTVLFAFKTHDMESAKNK